MCVLWRSAAACWPIRALLVGLAFLVPFGSAVAQSSLGAPLTTATGRSLADAVGQNEKELINREVLGDQPGGAQAGRSATTSSTGGAAAGLNTFSTGRLRGSDHDALIAPGGGDPLAGGPYPYETKEYSVFGNIVVTVPGTVLGGQLKVSGFVGQNDVFLRLKANSVHILDPNQSGRATNQSIIVGGTALWYQTKHLRVGNSGRNAWTKHVKGWRRRLWSHIRLQLQSIQFQHGRCHWLHDGRSRFRPCGQNRPKVRSEGFNRLYPQ